MQQPADGMWHNFTVTGVPVTLLAISENGDVIDLGTTTSDSSGSFAKSWTPPSEGVYRITATFKGDDSYGSSWAETAVSIGPAPTPTETTEPQVVNLPPIETYFIGATAAIIIAVAIVGVLLLKKKQ